MAERKKRQAAAAAGMMNNDEEDGGNDYDDDDEQWTEESEFGRRGGRVSSKSKSRSEARGSGRRGTFRKNKGRWSRRNPPPSYVSSSGSPGWSPSQDTKDKGKQKREQGEQSNLRIPGYVVLHTANITIDCVSPSSLRTTTASTCGLTRWCLLKMASYFPCFRLLYHARRLRLETFSRNTSIGRFGERQAPLRLSIPAILAASRRGGGILCNGPVRRNQASPTG